MAFFGGQYAVTASAVNIATALAITNPGQIECAGIIISYNPAATIAGYLGPSTVTNVPANAAFIFPLVAANIPSQVFNGMPGPYKRFNLTEMFLVGTVNAANIFFISLFY